MEKTFAIATHRLNAQIDGFLEEVLGEQPICAISHGLKMVRLGDYMTLLNGDRPIGKAKITLDFETSQAIFKRVALEVT